MLGIKLRVTDIIKLGGDKGSGQVLSGGKVNGSSLVDFLWVEVVTELGMDGYLLGESLGEKTGAEGGLSGEISGVELDVSVLKESLGLEYGTEEGSPGDMTLVELNY